MNVIIKPSTRKDKKLQAIFPDGKSIHFGAKGYQSFPDHQDVERKKLYLARHKHDPKSIKTAGGLARDILWSEKTIPEAIKHTEKKHKIKITLLK